MKYLMVTGHGDPNTSIPYKDSISALYSVAYTLKFMIKKGPEQIDFKVMPLEGIWWIGDINDFLNGKKDNWDWTMMIRQPEFITEDMVKVAIQKAKEKTEKKNKTNENAKNNVNGEDLSGVLDKLDKMSFEEMKEGKCATIMHIGPFSAEGPTIERLHKFVADNGLKLTGKHREIYLSDIRKADPAKWRTVIRHPVS